jgi:hypothetical protein
MAIEKTLDSYLEKPNTDFALLLTSKWGVGKTYFVKKYFEKIANDTTVAYISLYGLSSRKEIDNQIFTKFYPNKHIFKKYGGALLKVLARNLDISDFLQFELNPKTKEHEARSLEVKLDNIDTLTNLFENEPIANKSKGTTFVGRFRKLLRIKDTHSETNTSFKALICLDDLERKSEQLSLKEVCGYINFLTESGFKVLVISNNDQIFDESFRALKEKTFGVEVVYSPNIEQLSNSIINEIVSGNEGYKEFLLKNINLLLDVFFKHTHNLRLFKLGLYHFEGVWNELSLHEKELSNLNLENTWPDLIRFICAILIESSNNVSCGGTLTTSGTINANGDKLNFPNTLNQYKINLWGINTYGFGIAGSTLQYSSQGNHSFYNSANNANTFTITSLGNVSCTGSIGCVGVSASGGMRIGSNLGIQNTTPLSMLHLVHFFKT